MWFYLFLGLLLLWLVRELYAIYNEPGSVVLVADSKLAYKSIRDALAQTGLKEFEGSAIGFRRHFLLMIWLTKIRPMLWKKLKKGV